MLHQIKAQQFYTDLDLQKIVEFKDFSRLLCDFPVLLKADLMLNSSTFQACANPGKLVTNPGGHAFYQTTSF